MSIRRRINVLSMTINEARKIATNPKKYPNKLRLARLKLINKTLRMIPNSPSQREIQQLIRNIEAMPANKWKLIK